MTLFAESFSQTDAYLLPSALIFHGSTFDCSFLGISLVFWQDNDNGLVRQEVNSLPNDHMIMPLIKANFGVTRIRISERALYVRRKPVTRKQPQDGMTSGPSLCLFLKWLSVTYLIEAIKISQNWRVGKCDSLS